LQGRYVSKILEHHSSLPENKGKRIMLSDYRNHMDPACYWFMITALDNMGVPRPEQCYNTPAKRLKLKKDIVA